MKGLEYSGTAVKACEKYAQETENEELYKARNTQNGKGSRVFVQGDFYADDWLERAGLAEHGKEGVFELIYDYTVSRILEFTASKLRANSSAVLLCNESYYETSLGEADVNITSAESSSESCLP